MAHVTEIDGFDPLSDSKSAGGLDSAIADEAIRREVTNILKSYTGYFDLFSELLQNALDALDLRGVTDKQFEHKIFIDIDIANNKIRVIDNGIGMGLAEFKFCFRPNVSFKQRRQSRGHKGVGATFIAYGFTSVALQSRKDGNTLAAKLNNGRQWADDATGSFARPKFEQIEFLCPELAMEKSGTCVEVLIGDKQRPHPPWLQATSAKQWLEVLRIKTPIGGIYLSADRRPVNPTVTVTVTDLAGTRTTETSSNIDYMYPHELSILTKTKSITEIEAAISHIKGDLATRWQRLPDEYRRLNAVYEIWTSGQILSDSALIRNIDEDARVLIERHKISLYGCFLSTATAWTSFQKDILKVRSNAVLLRGGLQMASDFMPQGDLLVIPLTSTIGYQANTHVIVHLDDGNPDMGRKVFQPEIKALAEELARRVVDIFKRYLNLMREDTGAATLNTARELRDFVIAQEHHREKAALEYKFSGRKLSLLSDPQSEQDVIALFHELLGIGLIRGIGIFATSESERYDSVFVTHYPDSSFEYNDESVPLGVSAQSIHVRESVPMVLAHIPKKLLDFFDRNMRRIKRQERVRRIGVRRTRSRIQV